MIFKVFYQNNQTKVNKKLVKNDTLLLNHIEIFFDIIKITFENIIKIQYIFKVI